MGVKVKLVTIGKKVTTFFKRRPQYTLAKSFDMGNSPTTAEAQARPARPRHCLPGCVHAVRAAATLRLRQPCCAGFLGPPLTWHLRRRAGHRRQRVRRVRR